jgi:hypothetical protein
MRKLRAEPLQRVFVDDLTVIQAYLVQVHDCPTGNRDHMEVLDAMPVGQRQSKMLPLFGRDELIDIDRVIRLIALSIATTVAKRLPASG